jgi:F420-non-reducing hydrogenase iron-sulfur subunit
MNNRIEKIYLFYCTTSLDRMELEQLFHEFEDKLKPIPLPCSGKVDILYLTKAFESGADGVVMVTCKEGECRYLEGNLRAKKRADAIDTLLEETGLGKGRMTLIQPGDGGIKQVIADIESFIDKIQVLTVEKQDCSVPVPVFSDAAYPQAVTSYKENRR